MGSDKAGVELCGRRLVEHVAMRFAPQCEPMLVSIRDGRTPPVADAIGIVDSVCGLGPLGGIEAALAWLATHCPQTPWLVSVPVDCPFLPPDLVDRLQAAGRSACATSGGRDHPTVALWHVTQLEPLRLTLHHGRRGVAAFLDACEAARVDWPALPVDPFFNVNTPEDLAAAARILSSLC